VAHSAGLFEGNLAGCDQRMLFWCVGCVYRRPRKGRWHRWKVLDCSW
jgi:hypothetical protein